MTVANPNNKTLWWEWGDGPKLNDSGGLKVATDWDQIKQRIIRRLLSNPRMTMQDGSKVVADYIFDQDYGIGMERLIGENMTPDLKERLRLAINQAVLCDEGIDITAAPVITFKQVGQHTYLVKIAVRTKLGGGGVIVLELTQD